MKSKKLKTKSVSVVDAVKSEKGKWNGVHEVEGIQHQATSNQHPASSIQQLITTDNGPTTTNKPQFSRSPNSYQYNFVGGWQPLLCRKNFEL